MAKKKDKKAKGKVTKAADSKPSKSKKKADAAKTSRNPSGADAGDMAHKIWLAGVGAYGKAYDAAIANSKTFNKRSTEVFEELVKRGEKIERQVHKRAKDSDLADDISKFTDAAQAFQARAREDFQARLDQMRNALTGDDLEKKGTKLAAKLTKLEQEVADAVNTVRSASEEHRDAFMQRLSRLSDEIETVASEAGGDVLKTGKKAAKRTSQAVHDAIAPIPDSETGSSNDKAGKSLGATRQMSDDLTRIVGVGPALASKLMAAGVTSFAEIAAMNKAEIEALDAKIAARGRIVRDEWVKQARAMLKAVDRSA